MGICTRDGKVCGTQGGQTAKRDQARTRGDTPGCPPLFKPPKSTAKLMRGIESIRNNSRQPEAVCHGVSLSSVTRILSYPDQDESTTLFSSGRRETFRENQLSFDLPAYALRIGVSYAICVRHVKPQWEFWKGADLHPSPFFFPSR